MYKLYLADINYNIISPINIEDGCITKLTLETKTNQARELTVHTNTLLDSQVWNWIKQPESNLVLEIENGPRIGFTKSNNLVTHLLPYAEVGSGSDYGSCVRLDTSVSQDSNYTISNEAFIDLQNRSGAYLEVPNTYQKKYYKIKPFSFANVSEITPENDQKSRQRLYNEASNYLEEIKDKNSIDSQIQRNLGILEFKFYSSTIELNTSKRLVKANIEYNDTASNLVTQIDPNFAFEILDDVRITLNTGMYSNFELLNEITKNRSLSWREIGLTQDNKTRIQIGNFDKLASRYQASNVCIDQAFDDYQIRIGKVTSYFPSLDVELITNQFIQEGENIQVDYREYVEGVETQNINQKLNYQGGSLELYKLL